MKNPGILSFFTFSGFTDLKKVETLFLPHHKRWTEKYGEHWTTQSTAKRLEGDYWNFLVPVHFAAIALPLLLIINWTPVSWPFGQKLLGLCVIGIVLFMILKTILYKPRYELHFLPLLNNSVQKANGEAKESMSKAKSGQYKTFTLLLIQYIFQQLSGCSKLSDGNIQRELLCKQYGISNDTLDAPLKNLLSIPYKDQSPRMQTTIQDYFEESRFYFASLNNKPALALLEKLELSMNQGKKFTPLT